MDIMKYLLQVCTVLGAVLLKPLTRERECTVLVTPGWVLTRMNFDPIQEIRPKVGGGHSFEGGRSLATLPPL